MVQLRYLFVVFVSLITFSAKTHHVIGGDAEWRVSSSGRVFRVGDKISLTEETIVEVESLEDFTSCNVVNPIRMYTDSDHHITLEKEGIRYFTSANPENCKNGLKLPVHVLPIPLDAANSFEPFWPEPPTEHSPPPFEPWPKPFPPPPHFPDTPPPYVPLSPPPHFPDTPPPHVPHSPPPPPHVPHSPPPPPPPHVPHSPPPPPPHVPHSPPPPVAPSASTHLNGFSFVLFAAMALCYIGQL